MIMPFDTESYGNVSQLVGMIGRLLLCQKNTKDSGLTGINGLMRPDFLAVGTGFAMLINVALCVRMAVVFGGI